MKIKFTLIFIIINSYVAIACYSSWNNDFNAAYDEYLNDIDRCSQALSSVRCLREAELSFNSSVESASDSYHDCLEVQ